MFPAMTREKGTTRSDNENWVWWCTPLNSALGMQRQADLYEVEASLVAEQVSGQPLGNPVLKRCPRPNTQRRRDQ